MSWRHVEPVLVLTTSPEENRIFGSAMIHGTAEVRGLEAPLHSTDPLDQFANPVDQSNAKHPKACPAGAAASQPLPSVPQRVARAVSYS